MFSLHVHSNYSLLEGTITIEALVQFAKQAGSVYASLTDTNSMYGLIKFVKIAKSENIKPILGTVIDDGEEKVVLLAKNNTGYSDMCKIITAKKLKDNFSITNMLQQNLSNMFVIINSVSLLEKVISLSIDTTNVYAELIITEKAKKNTRKLYNFAKKNKIKVLASHPAYFEKKDDFLLHKTVTAIRTNNTLENLDSDEITDEEYYLKSPEELWQMWRTLPEAVWNTDDVAQNCNVDLQLGRYKFPQYELPIDETPFSYLWKLSFKGLSEKYQPITEKAVKRLQYELDVIDELGFCDYFLIVGDIVRESRSRRMMNIGRGSAANSLVAFCLGFTQLDPIKFDLYFERFLNRGRVSPPDVDLDFSWRERDSLVKYIFEKYGYDRVAMISTTVTFRARSAFRETAKVFGIPDTEISKFSRFIPWTSATNLPILAEKFPESKSLNFKIEPWSKVIEIASKLAGYPHHLSIHPSGIVITKEPITNYVALEYAKNKGLGIIVTQPDMYSIEDYGLIKIDLLSQRSLGVLRDTLQTVTGKSPKIVKQKAELQEFPTNVIRLYP